MQPNGKHNHMIAVFLFEHVSTTHRKPRVMKTATVIEIIFVIVLAVALILYLMRRNVKDEEDNNPDLTKAFKDAEKKQRDEQ